LNVELRTQSVLHQTHKTADAYSVKYQEQKEKKRKEHLNAKADIIFKGLSSDKMFSS